MWIRTVRNEMQGGFTAIFIGIFHKPVAAIRVHVGNIVTSPREWIYWSMPGMGYESKMATALNLQYITKNRSVQSYLGTKRIGNTHTLEPVRSHLSPTFLSILRFSNSRAHGSAWYDVEWVSLLSDDINSVRCLAALIWRKCPSHICWNVDSTDNNFTQYGMSSYNNCTTLRQLVFFVSFCLGTCVCPSDPLSFLLVCNVHCWRYCRCFGTARVWGFPFLCRCHSIGICPRISALALLSSRASPLVSGW